MEVTGELPIVDHNASLPSGYLPTANQVFVHINGTPIRVVRYQHFDVPIYFVHASLPEGQEHRVSVTSRRYQNSMRLYPRRLGSEAQVPPHKKPMSFTVRDNPHLVLESDGLGYVLFAFDPFQPEPQGAGVVRTDALGLLPDAHRLQTTAIQAAIDRVSADPALHTLVLSPGLYRAGDLRLRSNCRLHLASGAVLKASNHASDMGDPAMKGWDPQRASFINAREAEDFAVTGHGHIDGNRANLDLEGYNRSVMVLTKCRRVLLDGPVFSDSCWWNTQLRNCQDVTVRRVKILNNRPMINCINTDGINPDGSSRVTIEHCMMHTGDDAVAVKSTTYDGTTPLDVADITVTDLLAINNSTTAKIGTETCADAMERITFRRIDAVRTARLCAIDAFDRAHIRDVVFEDCHWHRMANEHANGCMIDMSAPATAWRPITGQSRISRVRLDNISSEQPARCVIEGRSAEYGVDDVLLSRITAGERTLGLADMEVNPFAKDVTVE